MGKEYKGGGPYLGHVDTNGFMQGTGREVANLSPAEWTELVLTGRYMVP